MQYKIPVQIENEDPIIFGLSLRQIVIIMIWFWISSVIFNSLEPKFWQQVALLPSWIMLGIAVLIAVLKIHHMTFFPFILALSRNFVNPTERFWVRWVDSFQPIDVWNVFNDLEKEKESFEKEAKKQRLSTLDEKLSKI